MSHLKPALRFLFIFCAVCAFRGEVLAQNQATVRASYIQDITGSPLASGQICFTAVTNSGVPINYQLSGGAQVIGHMRCAAITNGAFSILLSNVANTTPANVCYSATIRDLSTGQIVNPPAGTTLNGYSCVQPSSSSAQSGWCSVTGGVLTCDFDDYQPQLAPQVLTTQGAVISGTPVTGHCVDWVSGFLLGDAGAPCGSGDGGGSTVYVNGAAITSPHFNATTPAAGSGMQNVTLQVSGNNVSAEVPTNAATATALAATPSTCSSPMFATGVTAAGNAICALTTASAPPVIKTVSYTATSSDGLYGGTTFQMDCVNSCTFTVPSSAPASGWRVDVVNPSSSTVTVSIAGPNAGVFAGCTSNICPLIPGQHAVVTSDGTYYYGAGTAIGTIAAWGLTSTAAGFEQIVECNTASATVFGCLATSDWSNFNSKLADPGANGIVKRTAAGVTAPATSSDIISTLGYTPASTSNVAANIVTVVAANDDSSDVSSIVSAALTAIYNEGGGTVFFPAGTYQIQSQVVIPNNAASPPKHPYISIQCAGGNFSLDGTAPSGGTILDLRYSGSGAKIEDFAFGTLQISGCTFEEQGASTTTPFIMTTNATLQLHDNFVNGYNSNTGTGCDQDFLILGGTTNATTGDATGWFQGYGGYVSHNFAAHIRRFAYLQCAANSIPITQNTIFFTSGSNLTGGAAIELGNTGVCGAEGNVIEDNLIESPFYVYPVKVVQGGQNTLLNQFWDCSAGGAVTSALYDFESGAGTNFLYEGFHDIGCSTLYRDITSAPGQVVWSSSGVKNIGPVANFGQLTSSGTISSQGVNTISGTPIGTWLRWNNSSGSSSNWRGELFAYDYGASAFKTMDVDGYPLNLNANSAQQVNIGGPALASFSLYSGGVGTMPTSGIYLTQRYNSSNGQGEIFTYNYGTSSFLPTSIKQLLVGSGSAASGTPGTLGFNGYTNYGLAFNTATGVTLQHAGTSIFGTQATALEVNAGASVAWSATGYNATLDTGLSRSAAGVVNVGNGTPGDASGDIKAAHAQVTLSTPASSSATCTAGQMWADASYVYVCTAASTIKRIALTTF